MALVPAGWVAKVPPTKEPGLSHVPSIPNPAAWSAEHGAEPATSAGFNGNWAPWLSTVSVDTGAVRVGSPMVIALVVPAEPSLHADVRVTSEAEFLVRM